MLELARVHVLEEIEDDRDPEGVVDVVHGRYLEEPRLHVVVDQMEQEYHNLVLLNDFRVEQKRQEDRVADDLLLVQKLGLLGDRVHYLHYRGVRFRGRSRAGV